MGTAQIHHTLVDFNRPIAVIPSLAIHLDREANSKRSINAQTDIPPITARAPQQLPDLLREQIIAALSLEEIRKPRTSTSLPGIYRFTTLKRHQPSVCSMSSFAARGSTTSCLFLSDARAASSG